MSSISRLTSYRVPQTWLARLEDMQEEAVARLCGIPRPSKSRETKWCENE
jgi:hypothetical protein